MHRNPKGIVTLALCRTALLTQVEEESSALTLVNWQSASQPSPNPYPRKDGNNIWPD